MNLITALANCAAYFGKWFTSDEAVKARKDSEKAAIDSAGLMKGKKGKKMKVNALKKVLNPDRGQGRSCWGMRDPKVGVCSFGACREVYPGGFDKRGLAGLCRMRPLRN